MLFNVKLQIKFNVMRFTLYVRTYCYGKYDLCYYIMEFPALSEEAGGGRGEGLWIIIGLVARVKKDGGGGCLGRSNKVKKLRLLTAKVCRRMT